MQYSWKFCYGIHNGEKEKHVPVVEVQKLQYISQLSRAQGS